MTLQNNALDKPEIVMIDDAIPHQDDSGKAPSVRVVEGFHVLGLSDDDVEFYNNYTPEMRKKTMRKVFPGCSTSF